MKITPKLVLSVSAAILVVSIIMIVSIISVVTTQQTALAYDKVTSSAQKYAGEINTNLERFKTLADSLTFMMEKYDYTTANRTEVNAVLKNLIDHNPQILGIYTAFGQKEPGYSFDGKDSNYVKAACHDETGRFIPYWNRLAGDLVCEPLLDIETSDWYQVPYKTGELTIFEPFIYEGVQMVSFIHPMRKGDFGIVGVSGVDVSLDYIDELAGKTRFFETGYAVVLSNKGIFMAHPTDKSRIGTASFKDMHFDETQTDSMLKNIEMGKGGNFKSVDPATGKEVAVFYEPIQTGEYSFVAVVPINEMLAGVYELRNIMLVISILSILVIVIIIFLIATSIVRPLVNLTHALKRVGEGDTSFALSASTSSDEIGDLSRSFVQMASDLKTSRAKLEEYNKTLESKVAERTEQLQSKNDELERFNKLVVDREMKMIEMKNHMSELEQKDKPAQ
jgi:hypothetical protein